MTSREIIALLVPLVIAVAFALAGNTRAAPIKGGHRLRPTFLTHAVALAIFAIVAVLSFRFYMGDRRDQAVAFWTLLVSFGVGGVGWVWYFYNRCVYWNDGGVGKRSFFGARFVTWDRLDYAGRAWDGGFVLKSRSVTIRYTMFDGGHEQLNAAISDRAPQFAGNF